MKRLFVSLILLAFLLSGGSEQEVVGGWTVPTPKTAITYGMWKDRPLQIVQFEDGQMALRVLQTEPYTFPPWEDNPTIRFLEAELEMLAEASERGEVPHIKGRDFVLKGEGTVIAVPYVGIGSISEEGLFFGTGTISATKIVVERKKE